jgi:lysophospholipase L1-like esterase
MLRHLTKPLEIVRLGTLTLVIITATFTAAPAAYADQASVWGGSATPSTASYSADTSPVTLGMRFHTTQAGQVTSVSIFRGAELEGDTHVYIYDALGNLLGSGTLAKPASFTPGWRTVPLDIPVNLNAYQTYVVAYFADNGRYAYDDQYFCANHGVPQGGPVVPELEPDCSQNAGHNGVYHYGIGFPSDSFHEGNYWVDPVFSYTFSEAPVISAVAATNFTSSGATITWVTDKNSDSQLEYGTTTAYGSSTPLDPNLVTSHLQALTGLTPRTIYHYRVKSQDAGGHLGTSGDFTLATGASASFEPMPIIGRNVPAYASSGTASYANDGSYGTVWRTQLGVGWIAYDLSAVPAAQRQRVLAVYYTDSYAYTLRLIRPHYNNWGDYQLQINTAAGGGQPPSTGWVTVLSVSGNTFHSRQHLVDIRGANWVRANITASDGADQNMDAAANSFDLYDASAYADNIMPDDFIFYGDSITAGGMSPTADDNTIGLVHQADPIRWPVMENGGDPFETSGGAVNALLGANGFLSMFPGKYVGLSYGMNDAAGAGGETDYYNNMKQLVVAVLNQGKIPMIPTISYTNDPNHNANIPAYNAKIQQLYSEFPPIVHGPDFWTFFQNNPNLIGVGDIHPTGAGYKAMAQQWAHVLLANVYNITPPTPPVGRFWPDTAVPAIPSVSDTQATQGVEVGLKFRSDVDGVIKGVRFYKGTGNTGTHVGQLWSSTGDLLGSVTFAGESGNGWQQALFSSPVAISANTTYVVSYYAPAGHYSANSGGLATSVDNSPLHALAGNAAGGNGVYFYTTNPAGGFPINTYGDTNYWVDVVFETNGVAP